jgi:Mrp family chromosome partitioning ATPase
MGSLNLMRRRWLFVSSVAVIAVFSAITHHRMFPRYVAQSALIVRNDSNSALLRVFGKISGANENESYGMGSGQTQVMFQLLQSNSFTTYVEEEVAKQVRSNKLPGDLRMPTAQSDVELTVSHSTSNILSNHSLSIKDDLITIFGYAEKREGAEEIARWMSEIAKQYLVDYELKEIVETEKYLVEESDASQARIVRLIGKIDQFRRDPNYSGLNSDSILDRSIGRIREELEMVKVEIAESKNFSNAVESQIRSARKGYDGESQATLFNLRGRMLDRLKDSKTTMSLLKSKESALKDRLKALIGSMKPQQDQEVLNFKRRLEVENSMQQELQKQIFSLRVYKISVDNKVRTYNSVRPGSAVRDVSLVKKFGIALVFAICGSILAIYIWEFLYPVMSERHDFLRSGVRFLGSSPKLFGGFDFSRGKAAGRSVFVKLAKIFKSGVRTPESTAVQFLGVRMLHNLERVTADKKAVISVLSALPGEGKTLISNCIAASMGLFNSRVLVIDGDVLRVKGENLFMEKDSDGLSEYFDGKMDWKSAVHVTDFKNVSFLSRGVRRLGFGEFNGQKFTQLINEARAEYDIIVIDTPAFSVGTEAIVMAGSSDVSVVVASAHKTGVDVYSDLIESLNSRGVSKIYGVLNRVVTPTNTHSGYYYNPAEKSGRKLGEAS